MKKRWTALLLCLALLLSGCSRGTGEPAGTENSNHQTESSTQPGTAETKPGTPGDVADLGDDNKTFGEDIKETGAYDGYFEGESKAVTVTCVSGTKNAYKMLGCMLGVWATYECDLRWTKFETKAPLLGQILKLALGFGVLLAIKVGAKAPLQAIMTNDFLADGIRYLLMVVFAGCIWPLTFRFFAKLGKKK